MRDLWQEIFISMRTNKLRTFLTGFAVSWGIFMLILLLAAGKGLQHGIEQGFAYSARNSLEIYAGFTQMPYQGLGEGRRIHFTAADVEFMRTNMKNITAFSAVNYQNCSLTFGDNHISIGVEGVEHTYPEIRTVEMVQGRFLNKIDDRQQRKVIVLHKKICTQLFNNVSPLGQYITVNNVPFLVVGIYNDESMSFMPSVYVPYGTAQALFNPSGWVYQVMAILGKIGSAEEGEAYNNALRAMLGKRLRFDAQDQNAIWIHNQQTNYLKTQMVFSAIALFVWLIGIGTLIAGLVGVSNIMLITVKERTREFGIRKALGATPNSILRSVVLESLTTTLLFGYIGLLAGIVVTELFSKVLAMQPSGNDRLGPGSIFTDPTVNINIALAAMLLLAVAGVVAGYIPARRAVRLKPIEALNTK